MAAEEECGGRLVCGLRPAYFLFSGFMYGAASPRLPARPYRPSKPKKLDITLVKMGTNTGVYMGALETKVDQISRGQAFRIFSKTFDFFGLDLPPHAQFSSDFNIF
jgi:hypothetical protein